MSTHSKIVKRLVSLGVSKISVVQLISDARSYVTHMTTNAATFPNPSPTLAAITAQTNLLETDYNISVTRVRGSVAKMRTEEKKLIILLKGLASYVETVANADSDHALDIIPLAGMNVKKSPIRKPRVFTAVNGKLKGTVALSTKGISRGTYIYQMTIDPNTVASWAQIYTGSNVKFTKTGLTSGTRYYFRSATSSKGIEGDWTVAIDVLVQ
jgi:hypothetical protein